MTASYPAWIEVNLSAIEHNYRSICSLMGASVRVIPVVKADAYGHGMPQTAIRLQQAGATHLAVTHVAEALELREAGYSGEILVLTPPRREDAVAAAELNADACVVDLEGVRELSEAASRASGTLSVHLKIDTGMGRLGVRPDGALELARAINSSTGLRLSSVFSHCADGANEPAVARQLRVFRECSSRLRESGIDVPLEHIAASAASLSLPEARMDAVRVGTLLYGQYPRGWMEQRFQPQLGLRPTWAFCTRIISVRSLPPGTSIGYSSEFQTSRVSRIAIVPVGVADGLGVQPMSLQRGGIVGAAKALLRSRFSLWAEVREQQVPIVGRVATQLSSIDVTDVPDVEAGDVVRLPVRRLLAGRHIPRVHL